MIKHGNNGATRISRGWLLIGMALLLAIGGDIGLAQSEPSPGLDLAPWSPEKESFSTEAPREMRLVEDQKKEKYAVYSGRIGTTFFFAVSEPSNKKNSAVEIPRVFARRFVETSERKSNPGITTESFNFKDDESFYHRLLLVDTADRHLAFHTVSLSEKDQMADRFFSQLRIDNQLTIEPSNEATGTTKKPPEDAPSIGFANAVANKATGTGTGSGSGSGSGSGPSTTVPPNLPRPPSSPFKITSKPKAAYTDIARFYNLSGTVRVKITLLAAGQVGSVTPVSRLPFGLTTTAIKAAKSIEFEPKTIAGVPQSVVVTVEYVFTIY